MFQLTNKCIQFHCRIKTTDDRYDLEGNIDRPVRNEKHNITHLQRKMLTTLLVARAMFSISLITMCRTVIV